MIELIRQRFDESSIAIRAAGGHLAERVAGAAGILIDCLRAGGGVFTFGNGGSAADAQHVAAELVGRFLKDRPALRAQALSTDTSTLTAIANDFGLERIFARQLEAMARPGDVAVGISTSGNSPNVVAGLAKARQLGLRTIALTGAGGGRCAELADVLLDVPQTLTPRIQEAHVVIYHVLCELVERAFLAGQ